VSANVFRSHDESLIIPVFIGLSYDHSPKKGFEVGMATFNGDHVTDVTYDTVILKEKQTTPLLYQVLHSRELFTQLRVYVRNMDSGRFSYQQVSLEPRNLNEALSGLGSQISTDSHSSCGTKPDYGYAEGSHQQRPLFCAAEIFYTGFACTVFCHGYHTIFCSCYRP